MTVSSSKSASTKLLLVVIGLLAIPFSSRLWQSSPHSPLVTRDTLESLDADEDIYPSNSTLLHRRGDYSCGKGKPCSNGACCGQSGYCGYGPTYCGSGCISNCNAVAECGQYATPAGKKCPLNTCCSQYGFCGTTTDFCTNKCQSNCVEHPQPPGGKGDGALSRVIGYYEAWSARSTCHKFEPTNLPVHDLTHVNFAFAYIDPRSYKIVTMDTATDAKLFRQTADLKSANPGLKIFVSVGGWTFSDNDTATQPLYGEIAADPQKRLNFANNVVKFMQQYGFDGLDIDWEYPGAPDRGGKERDTANFVSLLQTLRATFTQGTQTYGLTFTAPSSYWYLRWFDLPNLIKYADWINLMSYDLHGVWDRNNPIGSIVQGHTNLTEIKLAAELFWRVNIPPGKLVMGFGFYGRSFTLSNAGCSKPGCPFSGASKSGPCTKTGGILGYYEIQQILSGNSNSRKRATLSPVHDTAAAVNYLVFDNDQWVSYDDKVTFKQKVDWANSVGMGGSLIWASDLDDPEYSAHSGLLGKQVTQSAGTSSQLSLSEQEVYVESLMSGQGCERFDSCVHLDNPQATNCERNGYSGMVNVGWDDAGCGSRSCHCGKPICCPKASAPSKCTWRGGKSGDCNAHCNAGEVSLFDSSWGGGYTNDGNTNKCGRGRKSFCCEASEFKGLTQGCISTKCGDKCPTGYDEMYNTYCGFLWTSRSRYCCPSGTNQLKDCHWVSGSAKSDCANPQCKSSELDIATGIGGDGDNGYRCQWGRKKSVCCSVASAPKPAQCNDFDLCKEIPEWCPDANGDLAGGAYIKRDVTDLTYIGENETSALEKRGPASQKPIRNLITGLAIYRLLRAAFPASGLLYSSTRGAQALRAAFGFEDPNCNSIQVRQFPIPPGNYRQLPGGPQRDTEHPVDASYKQRMIENARLGRLPSGGPANSLRNGPIPDSYWQGVWNAGSLPGSLPVVGVGGINPNVPNARADQALGTNENRNNLLLTDSAINGAKGNFFYGNPPMRQNTFQRRLSNSVASGDGESGFLQPIRAAMAVIPYMNLAPVTERILATHRLYQAQMELISLYTRNEEGGAQVAAFNLEFRRDLYGTVQENIQTWALDRIRQARYTFQQAGPGVSNYAEVMAALSELESQAQFLQFTFLDEL